jgi:hypothetical protein
VFAAALKLVNAGGGGEQIISDGLQWHKIRPHFQSNWSTV